MRSGAVRSARSAFAFFAFFASLAAAQSLAACVKDDAPKPGAATDASPLTPPAGSFPLGKRTMPSPFTSPPTPASPRAPLADCRAIAIAGTATARDVSASDAGQVGDAGTVALSASGVLPEGKWIDLAPASASLTVKDPRTARETIYSGLATFRPCVAHAEETWLARGTLETSPGSGEAPGSEEWVVTPAGVVRYTSSTKGKVRVTATSVTVEVVGGTARASFTGTGTDTGTGKGAVKRGSDAALPDVSGVWTEIDSRATLEAHVTLDLKGAKEATERCVVAANHARDLAAQIVTLADRSALGTLAAEHLSAVVVARATCAPATLRVALLPAPSAREAEAGVGGKTDLAAKLESAERAWRNAAP